MAIELSRAIAASDEWISSRIGFWDPSGLFRGAFLSGAAWAEIDPLADIEAHVEAQYGRSGGNFSALRYAFAEGALWAISISGE